MNSNIIRISIAEGIKNFYFQRFHRFPFAAVELMPTWHLIMIAPRVRICFIL